MLDYDYYIVAFSGGKDSMACFLHLLDQGVPREKIELWHHDVDGQGETFMDWECTPDYCRKIAEAFGVKIYFSWKEGGFLREMLRENQRTAPIVFEHPDGVSKVGGDRGKESTRLKFPQISPNLSVRWCSSYLKIDPCATAIRHQDRFDHKKTLVISGERGEESSARAKYEMFEPDRADNRLKGKKMSFYNRTMPDGTVKKLSRVNTIGKDNRHVDRWRPIRDWTEQQVWEIIEKYKVRAHPAYYLGWGRVSCKFCIFGNADQFASAYKISPTQGDKMIQLEGEFGCTMKRNTDLKSLIAKGVPYNTISDEMTTVATSEEYKLPIFMDPWVLPAGAYGDSCGPT